MPFYGVSGQKVSTAELGTSCKVKVILQTSNWFPYLKKRAIIVYEEKIFLNPLETATDELKQKAIEFEQILKRQDSTLLELFLQGAILPQVHAGPLALAEKFLNKNASQQYDNEHILKFNRAFRHMLSLFKQGVDLFYQSRIANSESDETILNLNKLNYNMLSEKLAQIDATFNKLNSQVL